MMAGKSISGAIEGGATPTTIYIYRRWWAEGKQRLERSVKAFKAEELAQAIQEMHEGTRATLAIV
jgi:Zn-dependent alcohol dehydrogenase